MATQSPTATLRQGILTQSFPDATPATFWQMALSDFSVVGFAVRSTDKQHDIVMTTDADTPRVLAQYTNGGAAQDALGIVLKAVQGRTGDCANTCSATPSRCGGAFRCLLRWTLRLILLGLLLWVGFMLWNIFGPTVPPAVTDDARMQQHSSVPTPQPAPQPMTAPPPTGVPLSADDVLGE